MEKEADRDASELDGRSARVREDRADVPVRMCRPEQLECGVMGKDGVWPSRGGDQKAIRLKLRGVRLRRNGRIDSSGDALHPAEPEVVAEGIRQHLGGDRKPSSWTATGTSRRGSRTTTSASRVLYIFKGGRSEVQA